MRPCHIRKENSGLFLRNQWNSEPDVIKKSIVLICTYSLQAIVRVATTNILLLAEPYTAVRRWYLRLEAWCDENRNSCNLPDWSILCTFSKALTVYMTILMLLAVLQISYNMNALDMRTEYVTNSYRDIHSAGVNLMNVYAVISIHAHR